MGKNAKGDTDDAAAIVEETPVVTALTGDTDDAAAVVETKVASDGDIVSGLKAMAKTASENSSRLMEKEAQEFGKLFAHSVISEFQKVAEEQEVMSKTAQQAYEVMDSEIFRSKLATVFDEAYTMAGINLVQKEAYTKTASMLAVTEKNAEAINAVSTINYAKDIVKEAYDMTQQFIDSAK